MENKPTRIFAKSLRTEVDSITPEMYAGHPRAQEISELVAYVKDAYSRSVPDVFALICPFKCLRELEFPPHLMEKMTTFEALKDYGESTQLSDLTISHDIYGFEHRLNVPKVRSNLQHFIEDAVLLKGCLEQGILILDKKDMVIPPGYLNEKTLQDFGAVFPADPDAFFAENFESNPFLARALYSTVLNMTERDKPDDISKIFTGIAIYLLTRDKEIIPPRKTVDWETFLGRLNNTTPGVVEEHFNSRNLGFSSCSKYNIHKLYWTVCVCCALAHALKKELLENYTKEYTVINPSDKGLIKNLADFKNAKYISLTEEERKIHDNYYTLPVFRANAKRKCTSMALWKLPGHCIWEASKGKEALFLKGATPKTGTWIFDLKPYHSEAAMLVKKYAESPEEWTPALHNFHQKIHADLTKLIGQCFMLSWPRMIVQDVVNFQNEYRFFIVNGRIVRGTPVRRADDIFDRQSPGCKKIEPFSCLHHDGHDRVPDRTRPARYTRLVRRILKSLRLSYNYNEGVWRRITNNLNLVIDIGEDENGVAMPVEFNSLYYAGTYGVDVMAECVGKVFETYEASLQKKDEPSG